MIADLVITDAKGRTRVVSAEEFMAGRKICRSCLLVIREGKPHTCPRNGENTALAYMGGRTTSKSRRFDNA